jgi:hypothetical protein
MNAFFPQNGKPPLVLMVPPPRGFLDGVKHSVTENCNYAKKAVAWLILPFDKGPFCIWP